MGMGRGPLTSSLSIALVVPLVLILSSAMARKLVRGSDWQRSDFYLGVQISFATFGALLINFFDLLRQVEEDPASAAAAKLASNGLLILLCVGIILFVMSMHQDWERKPQDKTGQLIWLGGLCNALGVGLMVIFVLLLKGGA